ILALAEPPPYEMPIERLQEIDFKKKRHKNIPVNDLFTLPPGVDLEMCKLENELFESTGYVPPWPQAAAQPSDVLNTFESSGESLLDLPLPTGAGEPYQQQQQFNMHNNVVFPTATATGAGEPYQQQQQFVMHNDMVFPTATATGAGDPDWCDVPGTSF
ncbi:hypothetical protein CEP52_017525, partial [Fusarium oligoseptatum]